MGERVTTGNLNFNREMAHASYIAKKSYESNTSEVIAPGFMTNVKDYFHDVLSHFPHKPNAIIMEDDKFSSKTDSCHATVDKKYSYKKMVADTYFDLKKEFNFD